jgi:hypothetical protein
VGGHSLGAARIVLKLVLAQIRNRPARALALMAGLLTAALSFVLLASAADTSDVRTRGSVKASFRAAYDILVRPRGSFSEIERRDGLVRNNYLSGVYGGISFAQYERIKRIRGVDVAAPIANVGFVFPFGFVVLPIDKLLNDDPVQLYRLRLSWRAHSGTSQYHDSNQYVYYTRTGVFEEGPEGLVERTPQGGEHLIKWGIFLSRPSEGGPFANYDNVAVFSERSPGEGDARYDDRWGRRKPGAVSSFSFPILLAGIDPEQEARLLELDHAIVSGRYVRSGDGPEIVQEGERRRRIVPAIAASRTYVGERLLVEIERLALPRSVNVPGMLASSRAYSWLTALPGRVLETSEVSADVIYDRMLGRDDDISTFNIWEPGETTYRRQGGSAVRPRTVTNPESIWETPATLTGFLRAPPTNKDLHFRPLRVYVGSNLQGQGGVWRTAPVRVVGRYDPERLPGFDPLSRVPLETYYPPELTPADTASRQALRGRPLLPTQNLGDYVQQPPLLLTTLEGIKPFVNPVFFKGTAKKQKAPISVIRVRVAGVKGPDDLSMARIRAVALAIREQTGLDVDITAGSSPQPRTVVLPPGRFGRPQLALEEGWVKKGVSVAFLRAADRKSLALTSLILVVCGFFVANGAFASVRGRRREIGTLRCLGWPARAIFSVVLAELALLGVVAGALGTGLAAAAVPAFGLEMSLSQSALVLPVAVGLALISGLIPAAGAARTLPLDAVRPAVSAEAARRRVHRLLELAFVNVRRVPARSLVAASALMVGVGALAMLLAINRAFEGTLVDTLLGQAILVRIQGVDYLAVLVTIGLATAAIGDVLYLSLRERAAELVTLRTFGWTEGHLRRLVALEGLGLGLAGGLAGATTAFMLSALLFGVPVGALSLTCLAGLAGGALLGLVASLAPLSQIARATPPAVLADE